YQPPFAASLGVFGKAVTKEIAAQFIQAIPAKFRLIEVELNAGNAVSASPEVMTRTNYVLDLNKPYDELVRNYRDNVRRNSKKAQQLNCRYEMNIPVEDVMKLSQEQMSSVSNLTEKDYRNFRSLYEYLLPRKQALACGVYSAAGELIASCVYFFSHK